MSRSIAYAAILTIIVGVATTYFGHIYGEIWPRYFGAVLFTSGAFLGGMSFQLKKEGN